MGARSVRFRDVSQMADAALSSLGDGRARHADHSHSGLAYQERPLLLSNHMNTSPGTAGLVSWDGWLVRLRLQLFLVLAAVDNMDLLAERQVSERAKSTCQFFALFYAFARTC